MRIADIKYNDIVDCPEGICVSLWMQGCPHRCEGCHNPETWSRYGGYEIDRDIVIQKIIKGIKENDIERNFSILGGEPLSDYNRNDVAFIIDRVKQFYPTLKIYLWTGYTLQELRDLKDENINYILSQTNLLIDGRYIKELRDIRLPMRGSSNQNIYILK